MLKLHEFPEQFVIPLVGKLQPAKIDPPFAVAVKVPTSLFPRLTKQVAVQVVLLVGSVVSESATLPPPVPKKNIASVLFASACSGVATLRRKAQQNATPARLILRSDNLARVDTRRLSPHTAGAR